jgi:intein-encoded DNA endonuclease-like protein
MNTNKIIKLYTEKDLSTYEIAKKLGTYPNKIRRVLVSNGIELRSRSSAQRASIQLWGLKRLMSKSFF